MESTLFKQMTLTEMARWLKGELKLTELQISGKFSGLESRDPYEYEFLMDGKTVAIYCDTDAFYAEGISTGKFFKCNSFDEMLNAVLDAGKEEVA